MALPLNVRGHCLRTRRGGLTHFPWVVAANSKPEDEIVPWDFSNSTEKAWEAFEPTEDHYSIATADNYSIAATKESHS